jgi:hypothetical protein
VPKPFKVCGGKKGKGPVQDVGLRVQVEDSEITFAIKARIGSVPQDPEPRGVVQLESGVGVQRPADGIVGDVIAQTALRAGGPSPRSTDEDGRLEEGQPIDDRAMVISNPSGEEPGQRHLQKATGAVEEPVDVQDGMVRPNFVAKRERRDLGQDMDVDMVNASRTDISEEPTMAAAACEVPGGVCMFNVAAMHD